jgi:hypothetical protein
MWLAMWDGCQDCCSLLQAQANPGYGANGAPAGDMVPRRLPLAACCGSTPTGTLLMKQLCSSTALTVPTANACRVQALALRLLSGSRCHAASRSTRAARQVLARTCILLGDGSSSHE